MRKLHLNLYGQVLFWFFLNLALVAAVIFLVVRVQFNVGAWSLFSGQVNERIEAMGELMAVELGESSRRDWDKIVARHEEAYGVTFSVVRPNGSGFFAGTEQELPEVLVELLQEKFPAPEGPEEGLLFDEMEEPLGPEDGFRRPPPRRDRDGNDSFEPPHRRPGPPERLNRPAGDRRPKGDGPRLGGPGRPRAPEVVFYDRDSETGRYWVAIAASFPRSEFKHPPDGIIVASAESLGGNDVFFDWRPWAWTLVGVLLVSALIWFPFVRRMSRRLRTLTSAAESISEGDFDVEVASQRTDELGRLSRAVQRMALRLDDYVSGQKRFLGDIAHELCSPLVRVRMCLGILEQEMSEQEQDKLDAVNEEVDELSQLVNELLDFSKASLKPESLSLAVVGLEELVKEVLGREASGREVVVMVESGLELATNADLLKRALGNVVRNAVRYAGDDSEIVVRALRHEGSVAIQVLDRGPGVPEEWLTRIFEPFSRPEKARTREGGGSGLGLAIAKTCTEALGGSIRGRNREGGGFGVEFRFPPKP